MTNESPQAPSLRGARILVVDDVVDARDLMRATLESAGAEVRGRRGRRLMRQRGERIERSFVHVYDTGGMRRTYLRGHANILKRLLIHAGGFNLGLVMRHLMGLGTPHGLQTA
jgi:transposase